MKNKIWGMINMNDTLIIILGLGSLVIGMIFFMIGSNYDINVESKTHDVFGIGKTLGILSLVIPLIGGSLSFILYTKKNGWGWLKNE